MVIIRMEEIKGKSNKRGVVAKPILKHEHAQVMNLNLQPGEMLPEHSVPVDVFFYVVEGRGTLKVGAEEEVVKERDIITVPPETTMSLKADQGENFVVLNVKTPSL